MSILDELKRGFLDPLTPDGDEDPASRLSREAGLRTPKEATEDFTGVTAANAALEGARLQEQFGREALAESERAQLELEETLAPFVGFGVDRIPQLQSIMGGNTADRMAASQPVMDLTKFARDRISANPALKGVDPEIINRAALTTGADLLAKEQTELEQAIRIGQASAAQKAAGQTQTGAIGTDLLSQIGNVRAAGGIGRAQALGQGAQNIVGAGSGLVSAFRG